MGEFVVKKITDLQDAKVGDKFPESDYATTLSNGKFVQMEFVSGECERSKIPIKPGIFKIVNTMAGLDIEKTSFTADKILDQYVQTKEIEDCIDTFFDNLEVYKEFGIEVPKRNIFLFGPPGNGKSTAITKTCNKYANDNKTAIVIWHTSVFESHSVKNIIQSFEYIGVERIIIIAEDLGGVEAEGSRMNSDSSLLSILDNAEKTFTIPVCIIATTNFPSMFLGNVLDRPGRFDDKIKIGYPSKDARIELLRFFSNKTCTQADETLISSKACESFSPAHIRESYVRSRLKKKTIEQCIDEIIQEKKNFNKAFEESGSMGLVDHG